MGGQDAGYYATAALYNPGTNTWSAAGTMSSARIFHTATLLGTGAAAKVLVAGGFDGTTNLVLSSADLYDPATNAFVSAGNMSTPRQNHTAALLPNGKVLVSLGNNQTALRTSELYDPAVVTLGGPTLTFPQNGVYQITLTFSGGTGCPDASTVVRLFNSVANLDSGHSAGFGTGSSHAITVSFLAKVQGSLTGYSLQVGRTSQSCNVPTPPPGPSTPPTQPLSPPAVQATILQVG